jgi:hypothetical protein
MTVGIPRQTSNPENNMPRLRPISLDKLKAGDKEEALRVIRDMCLLTPRGISQRQKPADYYKHDTWRGKTATLRAEPSAERYEARAYGYTDEYFYYTMKTLGVSGSWVGEHRFHYMVGEAFEDATQHKMTRSGRRLDQRMSRAWKNHIDSGKLGRMAFPIRVRTPQVRCTHGYDRAHQAQCQVEISASSQEEAIAVAKAMFAGQGEVDNYGAPWREGEESEIMTANLKASQGLSKRIANIEEQMAELQQHLDNMNFLREQVEMLATDFAE